MEDKHINNTNANEYLEEKKKFNSLITKLVITIVLLCFIVFACKEKDQNKVDLVKSFKMNNELICMNKIVSQKNGWKYHKKNERFYKGDDTFSIRICTERN